MIRTDMQRKAIDALTAITGHDDYHFKDTHKGNILIVVAELTYLLNADGDLVDCERE